MDERAATAAPVAPPPPSPVVAGETPAIETTALVKRYGERAVVDDLSIRVPRGSIAGFVGPNGAGKTTTLRMLLGHVRPTSGRGSVLGSPITQPRHYMHRVGALIEGPTFYPSLSAETNLRVLARLGGHPLSRIPGVLETVGLASRARDRVGTYSMGMKQRLGIAMALLPDPDLLILDEPVNGLDPPGIIEVRDLLRTLREQDRTVFVSSHLLAEVQQVADWMVILKEGRSLYCGTTTDLMATAHRAITAAPEEPGDRARVRDIVRAAGYSSADSGDGLRIEAPASFAAELNRRCAAVGITLVELHSSSGTLEETFLDLIGPAS